MPRKALPHTNAGAKDSSRTHHWQAAPGWIEPRQQGRSHLREITSRLLAKTLRHAIPLVRNLEDNRKKRGDFVRRPLACRHLRDAVDFQSLQDHSPQRCLRAAAVEVPQRRCDSFSPQVVAGTSIVKDSAPPTYAQRAAAAVPPVRNGPGARDHHHPWLFAKCALKRDGGVRGQQIPPRWNLPAQRRQNLAMDYGAVNSRHSCTERLNPADGHARLAQ